MGSPVDLMLTFSNLLFKNCIYPLYLFDCFSRTVHLLLRIQNHCACNNMYKLGYWLQATLLAFYTFTSMEIQESHCRKIVWQGLIFAHVGMKTLHRSPESLAQWGFSSSTPLHSSSCFSLSPRMIEIEPSAPESYILLIVSLILKAASTLVSSVSAAPRISPFWFLYQMVIAAFLRLDGFLPSLCVQRPRKFKNKNKNNSIFMLWEGIIFSCPPLLFL